jgi:hypothetical protein
MHKNTRNILGKPFSTKGKTQQSFAYIAKRRSTIHHQNLGHKRVLLRLRKLALRKVRTAVLIISDHALS